MCMYILSNYIYLSGYIDYTAASKAEALEATPSTSALRYNLSIHHIITWILLRFLWVARPCSNLFICGVQYGIRPGHHARADSTGQDAGTKKIRALSPSKEAQPRKEE